MQYGKFSDVIFDVNTMYDVSYDANTILKQQFSYISATVRKSKYFASPLLPSRTWYLAS